MALVDAVARTHGLPAWQLLGGKQHEQLPLAWTLASGDVAADVQEAQELLAKGRHQIFKIKIGARDPAIDTAHVSQIARALAGKAKITVDVNQAWDGNTARRYLPHLADSGVALVEQPVARHNLEALKQLTATQATSMLIMADESVCSVQDALQLVRLNASHVFSLKVAKHGGLFNTRKVAAIAQAGDIDWYGGTMLETSLGSAASAHLFSTLGPSHHGCELFGPLLLADDIVEEGMVTKNGQLQLPDGPGFGVQVSTEKLERFDRARQGLTAVHVDYGRVAPNKE
jgi:muconate cycloisomerase